MALPLRNEIYGATSTTVNHNVECSLGHFVACKHIAASRATDPGALAYTAPGWVPKLLIVSSDKVFASLLERRIGDTFEVHAAATGEAAFALLDAYSYACVVIDLCSHPPVISVHAVTIPVVALVPQGSEIHVPASVIACANDEQYVERVIEAVKSIVA